MFPTTCFSLVRASLLLLLSSVVVVHAQIPANATGVQTITSPGGISIRYKEPGICETTPGVRSYSGYVDLDNKTHMYFWFFEARENPVEAPTTLWLTGGPGSDSLIAALIENGPCFVITDNVTATYNPYSWNNHSNMLYLSQPIGVGFSYSEEEPGSLSDEGGYEPPSVGGITGEWPVIDPYQVDTTQLAAVGAWHTIQAFFTNLPHLDSKVESRVFNLWTESYGGHYGPVFYDYFYTQNQAILNGSSEGYLLNFDTLGIGNGLIDEYIQAPYYPEFAVKNTYGIVAVNETVYNYMKFALNMGNGCLQQIEFCRSTNMTSSVIDKGICTEAENMCRDNVEGPYYAYSGRGPYDIRASSEAEVPPTGPMTTYLNQASVQDALGVNLNYTNANNEVYYAFQQTGDFVYPYAREGLEDLLSKGVRVALYSGDADYICNWFGGQAVSLAMNYPHSEQFRNAEYAPFVINGTEYGEVRQYGNFSFLRIYEAGHQVPYFQPLASQAMFDRVIFHLDIATGPEPVTPTYETNGTAQATHTEPSVAVPTSTSG